MTTLPPWLTPGVLAGRRKSDKNAAAPQLEKNLFAAAVGKLYSKQARLGRYQQPFLLVCGDAAGAAGVLAAAELSPVAAASGATDGWWRGIDGAAFELPREAWQRDDGPWLDCLDLLERHRSRRPVDALVWIVPLAALDGDDDTLAAEGARLARKLRDLQVRLGIAPPVYLVISRCDLVPGFGRFAAVLPARARQQALGCTNPDEPGAAFRRAWVEQGVAALCTRLRAVVAEIGAKGRAEGAFDELYLLPDALAAALDGLPLLLDAALRRSASLAPPNLRGFYLTGHQADLRAVARTDADEFALDEAARLAAPAPLPTPVAFCAEVFTQHIFAEFGMALLVRRKLGGARGWRRWLAWGGVLAGLAWAALLPYAYSQGADKVRAMHAPLSRMAAAVAAHAGQARERQAAQPDVTGSGTAETLALIDAVPDWTLASPLLPFSMIWPLGADGELHDALLRYCQDVLVADIEVKLAQRGESIAAGREDGAAAGAAFAHSQAAAVQNRFDNMQRFVDATLAFEENRYRFGLMAQDGAGNWADTSQLLAYLFDVKLSQRSPASAQRFDRLMREVHRTGAPSGTDAALETALRIHVGKLHAAWVAGLLDRGQVAAASEQLAREIDALDGRPGQPPVDPAALEALIGRLESLLAVTRLSWTDGKADLGQPYRQLLARVAKSQLLGPETAAALQRGADEAQAGFLADVEHATQGSRAILTFDKDNRLEVSPEVGALLAAFQQLRSYAFAEADWKPSALPAGPVLVRWDVQRLEQAGAVAKDYRAFEADAAIKPPPRFRALLQGYARQRAGARLDDELALATRPAGVQDWRATNFEQAAQAVPGLIAALRLLGQPERAEAWQAFMDGQAAHQLQMLQDQLLERRLYLPDAASVALWNGNRLGALPAYGAFVSADMQDYLASQFDELGALADAARAPRAWLEASGARQDRAATLLVAAWRRLDAELRKYAAKDPASSLRRLEQFVSVDLNELDGVNCADRLVRFERGMQADYFQQQGQQAARLFLRRCGELQAENARNGYRSIAEYFNAALLNRYPFSASADAPPATPESVRHMLRQLDAHYDQVHQWLARQPNEAAGPALAFLDTLAASRALLGAMLAADGAGAPASLSLWPEFRVNRSREKGADQIIAWDLSSGAAAGAPGTPLAWRPGDPIAVRLRWAKNSEFEPLADPRAAAPAVDGKTAIWTYSGPWALLHLLGSHLAPPGDLGLQEAPSPPLLRFVVPLAAGNGKSAGDAIVYARLGVTAQGKPERLAAPPFPHAAAPALAPAAAIHPGPNPGTTVAAN
jgi:type VI secretion system protein ImpL